MRITEHREEKSILEKSIIIFYHVDCIDGFTAAWVAYKKFGDRAEYIAFEHNQEVPAIFDKEIYTVDITFPESETKKLMSQNKRLTSIDHHVSNKDVTLMTHDPLWALEHSGATLTWQYFFPEQPIPKFVLMVENYDLGKHEISGIKAATAYTGIFEFDFVVWSKLISDFEDDTKRKEMIEKGEFILRSKDAQAAREVNINARRVLFEGYEVFAINSSFTPTSLLCSKLIEKCPPFAIMWRESGDGLAHVSMRGDGTIDLIPFATKYGGGGHKNAAAFRLKSLADIPWKIVK
jgi:nanoRNase/pAp phosphatase (c-di-AMP/oligoRNAs hydrolase)